MPFARYWGTFGNYHGSTAEDLKKLFEIGEIKKQHYRRDLRIIERMGELGYEPQEGFRWKSIETGEVFDDLLIHFDW